MGPSHQKARGCPVEAFLEPNPDESKENVNCLLSLLVTICEEFNHRRFPSCSNILAGCYQKRSIHQPPYLRECFVCALCKLEVKHINQILIPRFLIVGTSCVVSQFSSGLHFEHMKRHEVHAVLSVTLDRLPEDNQSIPELCRVAKKL